MDIKDLNKSQLLLLAVLLSFVTSIATGITTVTLMQQAPESFTTPVNNIVRQTIEKIQTIEGKTTVQTVVIKEEDLVVDAIAKNSSAVFSVSRYSSDGVEVPAGFGFGISKNGIIVADALLVGDKVSYFVKNNSGKFKADFMFADKAGFSFLKVGDSVNGTDKLALTVPNSGDLNTMKIGQKILILGGNVSSFIFDGNKNIQTNIKSSNGGAIVLDIDGNALGIALSGEANSFAPIGAITDAWKLSTVESLDTQTAAPILAPNP